MQKPTMVKLRKWHFLFLGSALMLLAAYLWYWDWRILGIPVPLRAEHYLALTAYVVGVFILGVFIFRLTKIQVTVMLVWLIIVNLVTALVTAWILRTYPYFFSVMALFEVSEDPAYIAAWGTYFLRPALWSLQIGLLILWAHSLVMFFIRKPGDEPG